MTHGGKYFLGSITMVCLIHSNNEITSNSKNSKKKEIKRKENQERSNSSNNHHHNNNSITTAEAKTTFEAHCEKNTHRGKYVGKHGVLHPQQQ